LRDKLRRIIILRRIIGKYLGTLGAQTRCAVRKPLSGQIEMIAQALLHRSVVTSNVKSNVKGNAVLTCYRHTFNLAR
jgi:hypothetical protein